MSIEPVSIGEPSPGYKPPEAGGLPDKGRRVLAKAYAACRQANPGYSKGRCSKMAWGGVKNAGYYQDQDGNWKTKNESLPRDWYVWGRYWQLKEQYAGWDLELEAQYGVATWHDAENWKVWIEVNGAKRVPKPATTPIAGGTGSFPADTVDYVDPQRGEPGSIQGLDDKVPHGKFHKQLTPRARKQDPTVPFSRHPRDPDPEDQRMGPEPDGHEASPPGMSYDDSSAPLDARTRKALDDRAKRLEDPDALGYNGEYAGEPFPDDPRKFGRKQALDDGGRPQPAGVGDTLDRDLGDMAAKATDREPENPDDDMPDTNLQKEEEQTCMCGPRKELERYFDQENLQPMHFTVHISEHAMEKIPYWAKILAAFPTTSLNGRIYSEEVLNDAAKPYVGQPFIMDHDYEDSRKVHGQIVNARYGIDESPHLGREREGLWLEAIGLMDADLVPLIVGDQEHGVPALVRGVSIGGEGDAEPTRDGMRLKKFYPTELSVTAFPGIPGAHIADFRTITESYKSAQGNSQRMSGRGVWREEGLDMVKVHVPDIGGIANARGNIRQLENRLGLNQDVRSVGGDPRTGLVVEGPDVNSPDAFRRQITDQVPYLPQSTARSPIDLANPGFSSAPRATGYRLSTDSQPDQPWRGEGRITSMVNPNPIRDADRGKEEEEETARHHIKMAKIYARRAGINLELGPVSSDGSTVHGIAGTHKHLPDGGKPDLKRAAGVDNQPHALAGGNMKKIPGEAKITVSKPDEEEEEERMKAHGGLTCEKAHGVLPHSAWINLFSAKEGTEPLDYGDEFRGAPQYSRSDQVSPRMAAKQVGTISPGVGYNSEAKTPEEEEEEEEESHRHNMTLLAIHNKYGNTEAKSPEEEEEEEEENHAHARALINMKKYFRSQEGTQDPPAQGRGVPLPGVNRQSEEEERRRPFGPQYAGEASNIAMLTPRFRDMGSGVVQVTVNSLPREYQARLQGMANDFRSIMGIPPSRNLAESYAPRQQVRESYPNQGYRDSNRYPTSGYTGLPPLNSAPQSSMATASSLNAAVENALAQAAQIAPGDKQGMVKIAYNNLAHEIIAGSMQENTNAYLRSRRWR